MDDFDLQLLNAVEKLFLFAFPLLEVLAHFELLGVQLADPNLQLNDASFKPVVIPVFLINGLLLMLDCAITLFVLPVKYSRLFLKDLAL